MVWYEKLYERSNDTVKKIYAWEPWFFIVFGLFHLHRVWALLDRESFWWRWVYIFGGGYVLFDLFAIAAGLKLWSRLLQLLFDTASPYWNAVWSFFIVLGGLSFSLGVFLLYKRKQKCEVLQI